MILGNVIVRINTLFSVLLILCFSVKEYFWFRLSILMIARFGVKLSYQYYSILLIYKI